MRYGAELPILNRQIERLEAKLARLKVLRNAAQAEIEAAKTAQREAAAIKRRGATHNRRM